MGRYILRRLLISVPILLGLTVVTFVMASLMPGDYIDTLIPPERVAQRSAQDLAALRESYGLNQPVYVRYLVWLRELARGNLGYSFQSGRSVVQEILERLPATLQITVTALLIGVILGTVLGTIAALRQHSWLDQLLAVLGFVWISTPSFVFALGAIYIFSLKLGLLPTGGMGPVGADQDFLARLPYLILPATVLGLEQVASYMRYVRSSLLEVMRQEYVTVARAKGLGRWVVLTRHMFRNALLPMITIMGLSIPGLFGGAVIVETIIVWQGMGN
jgi:peptide/nickel transport system permease protein